MRKWKEGTKKKLGDNVSRKESWLSGQLILMASESV